MILVYGKNPTANVLHVITGPETDFWMQMHGAAAVDLTPVLQQMNHGQPVYLHVTRCDDEQDMASHLQSLMADGAEYPFVPPTFVFTPIERDEAGNPIPPKPMPFMQGPGGPGKPVVGPGPVAGPVPVSRQQHDKQAAPSIPKGKCSRCQATNVELVPKIIPAMCYGCVQIDLHLATLVEDLKKSNPEIFDKAGKKKRGRPAKEPEV